MGAFLRGFKLKNGLHLPLMSLFSVTCLLGLDLPVLIHRINTTRTKTSGSMKVLFSTDRYILSQPAGFSIHNHTYIHTS